jgi:hypothetical protein
MPRLSPAIPGFVLFRFNSRLPLLLAGLLLLAATPASADVSGAVFRTEEQEAQRSFERFVVGWLDEGRRLAASTTSLDARLPGTRPTADASEDWSIEIRPTRDASVPYVGILRYLEAPQTCANPSKPDCGGAATRITEIFRYEDGHWVH